LHGLGELQHGRFDTCRDLEDLTLNVIGSDGQKDRLAEIADIDEVPALRSITEDLQRLA